MVTLIVIGLNRFTVVLSIYNFLVETILSLHFTAKQ